MIDLKDDKEKNNQDDGKLEVCQIIIFEAKAIKTGVAFYSPYENKIEKMRKITNYKVKITFCKKVPMILGSCYERKKKKYFKSNPISFRGIEYYQLK